MSQAKAASHPATPASSRGRPDYFGYPFPEGVVADNPVLQRMLLQRLALDVTSYGASAPPSPPSPRSFIELTHPRGHQSARVQEEAKKIYVESLEILRRPPPHRATRPEKRPAEKAVEYPPLCHSGCCPVDMDGPSSLTKGTTDRLIILPGGMFAKPEDIYVESLPNGEGRYIGGCIAVSLQGLLKRYDALDRHYVRLKEENARLRSLLFDSYRLPLVMHAATPHASEAVATPSGRKPTTAPSEVEEEGRILSRSDAGRPSRKHAKATKLRQTSGGRGGAGTPRRRRALEAASARSSGTSGKRRTKSSALK